MKITKWISRIFCGDRLIVVSQVPLYCSMIRTSLFDQWLRVTGNIFVIGLFLLTSCGSSYYLEV
jgi:hypothetical protein